MKNMNKKGFTIVELVIVIAVIAILAAVLIPTFSGVVQKANESGALQEATSTMKSTLAMSDYGTLAEGTLFVVDGMGNNGYQFTYENNKIAAVKNAVSTVPYKVPAADATADSTCKNSIIINKEIAAELAKTSETRDAAKVKTVNDIITAAVVPQGAASVFAAAENQNYSYTLTITVGEGVDAVETVWNVYTNSDYATDVVTFTYSK